VFSVDLEDGHVDDRTTDEEGKKYGADGDVEICRWDPPKLGRMGQIGAGTRHYLREMLAARYVAADVEGRTEGVVVRRCGGYMGRSSGKIQRAQTEVINDQHSLEEPTQAALDWPLEPRVPCSSTFCSPLLFASPLRRVG